ncbi:MAG: hypothetical protein NWF00_09830 [Candidatus Bathyarchaeota archaeon]|nr:hypothetical protein [Candidatus Bathyarchaeota archaeon]
MAVIAIGGALFWIFAKLGHLTASFDNVMALFVVVFAVDLAITYVLVRKVMKKMRIKSAGAIQ